MSAANDPTTMQQTAEDGMPLPIAIKRAVKRGAETVVADAFDARSATHIAERDLARVRHAAALVRTAQENLQQADAQREQAAREVVAAQGYYQGTAVEINEHYALTAGDHVAEDGAIVRAAAASA